MTQNMSVDISRSSSHRKNRNLYAQLLLHMVKRGLLEDPFTRRPEAGQLQPLPSYMV